MNYSDDHEASLEFSIGDNRIDFSLPIPPAWNPH